MLTVRRAQDRGVTNWGWLLSRHTFSFGEYFDQKNMGFRTLRVINDDIVSPGQGFGTHGHRDMEIISYVLDGSLEHKDSMGTGSVIRPGEIQMMRAGTGIRHSEYNHSKTEPVHFLQIWIEPDQSGLRPAYAQENIDREAAKNAFTLLASGTGRDGSLQIHQDVELVMTLLGSGQQRAYSLRSERYAWVHIARGSVTFNGNELQDGDGVAVSKEPSIEITGKTPAEVLLFDLG
jgi:redox-sensitive bicupin YhaK (pirin superfamily)